MYVIGLTGGIASGKSTAAETLKTLGAEVIDADAISRQLTSPRGAAAPAIMATFGTLDRRTLGQIIFGDPEARTALNAIVHPLVHEEVLARIHGAQSPVVVLDVPLLYESGMESLADEVWVVHVPKGEQIRRVMARDGLSSAAAMARIDSQMPTEEKLARADATIDTSGTFAQTRMQIEALWHAALDKANVPPPTEQPPLPSSRRRRQQATRRMQQQQLEAQASTPVLSRVPLREAPVQGAWEDTSTLLDMPRQRSFLSRQPPLFWAVAATLLVLLLLMIGIIGVNEWREASAYRAEQRLQEALEREKAQYRLLYRDLIEQHAREQGVDPALVAAVIYNESSFDPQAESYLGARGLMQIMEETGEWIAYRLDEKSTYYFDILYDPQTNIRYGTWYLGYLSRLFDGDIIKVAAGYHAGQNAVQGWLDNPTYSLDGQTLEAIPYPDTEQYVTKVVTAYEMYKKHYYPTASEDPTQQQTQSTS